MRGGKRKLRDGAEPDEKFETEAFAFLNEELEGDSRKISKKKKKHESDTEPEFSGDSDSEVEEEILVGDGDDGDDDAPNDVGFADSKMSIMTQFRTAMQQIDGDKRKKKEQKRKVQAQFEEQRASKREKLSQSKLPTDFFNGLDEAVPKISKKAIKLTEPEDKVKRKQTQSTDAEIKEKKFDDELDEPNDDFIALSDSPKGVSPSSIKDLQNKTKTAAQIASDFRQNRLYGNHVRRQTNKQRLATAEKKKYAKKR